MGMKMGRLDLLLMRMRLRCEFSFSSPSITHFIFSNQHKTWTRPGAGLIHRASQKERIQLIVLALTNEVGKEALEHYGISPDPDLNSDTDVHGHGYDRDTGGGRGRV